MRWLSLSASDQDDQGQSDDEKQNHSWHVTEGSCVVDLLPNHIGFGAALRSFFHLCQQKLITRGTAVTERFQSATSEPRYGAQ